MINRWCTDLIAISTENHSFLLKEEQAPAEKITKIYHGISFESLSAASPESIDRFKTEFDLQGKQVFGTVARYIDWKRYKDLIDAFVLVKAKIPNAIFLGIGFGHQQEELQEYINERNLENSFILTGKVEKELMPAAYKLIKLYVHAAHMEPFGFVIPEAAANLVPILSTPTGAALDLIEEGKTGYLVDYFSPDQLGARMIELIDKDHSEVTKMAYEKALKMFAADRMWNEYVALYHQRLNK